VRVKTRDRTRVAADTRDTLKDWNGKMRIVSTLLVLLLGAAVPALAQEWPRLNVFGGAQFADFTTDVQLDASATVLGSSVDFERDLGFDNHSSMAWGGALWRISKRNQLTAGYVYVGRDVVQRQLQRSIRFGDETFDVNANVDAFINTWYLSASYRFAIVATPVVELGASIGITAINLSTGIQLSGSVSGPGGSTASANDTTQDASFTAPAPLPGAFILVRPHPRVTIRAAGGYIKADFGDLNGEMFQTFGAVDVMIIKWLGVGGAYSYNRLSVGVDDSGFNGNIRYSFGGPQVYGVLAF
jgi:hypothetical protein